MHSQPQTHTQQQHAYIHLSEKLIQNLNIKTNIKEKIIATAFFFKFPFGFVLQKRKKKKKKRDEQKDLSEAPRVNILFCACPTGAMGIHKTQPQDAVHNELASKMGLVLAERRGAGRGGGGGGEENYHPTMMSTAPASPPSSMSGMQPFYISRQSNQSSVATWLESKGFSTL